MLFKAVTALAGARTNQPPTLSGRNRPLSEDSNVTQPDLLNAEAIAAEDQSAVLTTNERTVLSSALVSM